MKKILVGFSLATALFIFPQQEDRSADRSLPVISPPPQTFLIRFGLRTIRHFSPLTQER